MNITHAENGPATIVTLNGNLDTATSGETQNYLDGLISDGVTRMVVDFTAVGFVSSAGLRVLLTVAKSLNATDGGLRIYGLNATVTQVFELTGFDNILNVTRSEEEALESY
jgi:anti-anti-sigma factor